MDTSILNSHINFIEDACAYWTHNLMHTTPIKMGDIERKSVPQIAGVYVIRNNGDLCYIGKSSNLRTRICSNHLGPRKRSSTLRRKVSKHLKTDNEDQITEWLKKVTIAWIPLGHHGLALAVEDYAIVKFNPPFNGYT